MLAILTQVRKFSGRIGGDHPEEFWLSGGAWSTPQKEGKTVDPLRDEAAITLMIVAGFVSFLPILIVSLRNVLIAVIGSDG